MATTSGTLVAGKAINVLGGNGNNGRYGLKAKVLAGVAILGCAAALAFGGLRASDSAPNQAQDGPAVSQAQSNGVLSAGQQRFLEENLSMPSGTLPLAATSAEMQYFLEENLVLPGAGADLLFAQDQFTYREDRRGGLPVVTAPALDWATILLIEQNQLPEITSAPPGMCLPGERGGCER